jgi:hypothetical protein
MERENVGHITSMEEMTNSFEILTERSERKRQLGRPRRRWNENIGSYLHNRGEGYELCSPGRGKRQIIVSCKYINFLVFSKIHVAFQMGYVPSGWL